MKHLSHRITMYLFDVVICFKKDYSKELDTRFNSEQAEGLITRNKQPETAGSQKQQNAGIAQW